MGDDLVDLLDDLAGVHPGIDMIRHGLAVVAGSDLTVSERQTLLHTLAGGQGTDLVSAIGLAVRDLTTTAALHRHPRRDDIAKEGHLAEAATYFWPERAHVAAALAHLDRPEGRCGSVDEDLRRKNDERNKQSGKWPH
ncbi:hypothetical protein [Streptomyces sp. 8L]|uniref:hypothetical protein n=1 Tax=Streptomyces sp. 8L TaxID=2877242 RepID=UPI001CD4175E|nr:hypothetical protein [Streptomyces sp. 8L]MCA1223704.1 hypothetical protein [Streptomyces sp. 8L]